jgi:hypothetical protein
MIEGFLIYCSNKKGKKKRLLLMQCLNYRADKSRSGGAKVRRPGNENCILMLNAALQSNSQGI